MAPSQIDQLVSRGYVVIDNAFDAEEAAGLELCLQLLDDSASLAPEPPGSGRDDSIRFVDESSAMLSIEVPSVLFATVAATFSAPYTYFTHLCDSSPRVLRTSAHSRRRYAG